MKLTDVKLRNLREPGKHFDGGGLYLEVTPAGGRYWRLKYRHSGREKRLAFGVYPEVSLADARKRQAEARAILARGLDPMEVRREAEAEAERKRAQAEERAAHEARHSFEAVAREWLKHQAAKWSPVTLELIESSLTRDVFPLIGARPMAQLRPRDVMHLAQRIEARGAGEAAGRTLQRVRAVFRYAVTHERIEADPMAGLRPSEVLKPRQVRHRAALRDAELPEFLGKLDAFEGEPTTKAALRLLLLTALRPGEVRGLRWAEVNTEAALLRIAPERMKMRREHVVPLSRQAAEVLTAQRAISGGRELVFPSAYYPGRPLSENTFNGALARMGFGGGRATAHGFRALFSTTANEAGFPPDVIERQLAHAERNEARAAYHRATYMEARRELLQAWADYLDGRRGGQVLKFAPTPKAAA